MSNDAYFQVHIIKLAIKCKLLAGWILRTFRTKEQETMMVICRIFALSHLDYCSQLWSLNSVKLTIELDVIYQSYTKRIVSMWHMTYWKRLKKLILLHRMKSRKICSDTHLENPRSCTKLLHCMLHKQQNGMQLNSTNRSQHCHQNKVSIWASRAHKAR